MSNSSPEHTPTIDNILDDVIASFKGVHPPDYDELLLPAIKTHTLELLALAAPGDDPEKVNSAPNEWTVRALGHLAVHHFCDITLGISSHLTDDANKLPLVVARLSTTPQHVTPEQMAGLCIKHGYGIETEASLGDMSRRYTSDRDKITKLEFGAILNMLDHYPDLAKDLGFDLTTIVGKELLRRSLEVARYAAADMTRSNDAVANHFGFSRQRLAGFLRIARIHDGRLGTNRRAQRANTPPPPPRTSQPPSEKSKQDIDPQQESLDAIRYVLNIISGTGIGGDSELPPLSRSIVKGYLNSADTSSYLPAAVMVLRLMSGVDHVTYNVALTAASRSCDDNPKVKKYIITEITRLLDNIALAYSSDKS